MERPAPHHLAAGSGARRHVVVPGKHRGELLGRGAHDVVATVEWRRGGRPFTLRFLSPAYVEHLSAEQGRPCSSGYRTFVQ